MDLLFLKKLITSLREATRVQAVVTIALIPLTLFWFYQISLISPIANAIAIPVISFLVTPCAMLGAFLPSILGDIFLHIAHASFDLLMQLLEPLASMEYAVIYGAKPPAWHLIIAMIGILLAIKPGVILQSWKSRLLGMMLCLSLFIPRQYWFSEIPYGELEMTVWDIGQGSAVLVKTHSKHLLFDTGPTSFGKFDPGEKIVVPHLRAEGITSIDQLVISHQDADHIGGLVYLLKNYPISNALGSIPPEHQLLKSFVQNRVPHTKCAAGTSWNWDGIEFRIWHPDISEGEISLYQQYKPNEMSCVLEIRNRQFSIWLTGDIERQAERLLVSRLLANPKTLQEIQKRQVIVMAPHHGSKTSSSLQLLEVLDPEAAFSQTGYKNRFRHPHQEVIDRYQEMSIELRDTVTTGAQIWQTEGQQIVYRQLRTSSD